MLMPLSSRDTRLSAPLPNKHMAFPLFPFAPDIEEAPVPKPVETPFYKHVPTLPPPCGRSHHLPTVGVPHVPHVSCYLIVPISSGRYSAGLSGSGQTCARGGIPWFLPCWSLASFFPNGRPVLVFTPKHSATSFAVCVLFQASMSSFHASLCSITIAS